MNRINIRYACPDCQPKKARLAGGLFRGEERYFGCVPLNGAPFGSALFGFSFRP